MRTRNQNNNLYQSMILGVALSVVTTVLLAALGAVFIDNETLNIGGIPCISYIVLGLSSFLCVFVSGRNRGERWLLRSGLAISIYYLLLIGVGILIFDGITGGVIYGLLAGLLGFAGAAFLISRRQFKLKNRKLRSLRI